MVNELIWIIAMILHATAGAYWSWKFTRDAWARRMEAAQKRYERLKADHARRFFDAFLLPHEWHGERIIYRVNASHCIKHRVAEDRDRIYCN